jgi:SAM-dependent methyltransferase
MIGRLLYGGRRAQATRRLRLAHRLRGEGIEIGALHNPLPLPPETRVRYLDRLDEAGLRQHYPELRDLPLVPVDEIDDGEVLATITDGSVDFVVANHLLEHCQDPVSAVEHWLRVLRPGGLLFLAVPDRRWTFDRSRPTTAMDHFLRDRREGPLVSRQEHYTEWARWVEGVPGEGIAARVGELEASGYSIHFHTWTAASLRRFLHLLEREIRYPFRQRAVVRNGPETLVLLERSSGQAPQDGGGSGGAARTGGADGSGGAA